MIAYLRALRTAIHAEAAGLPRETCYDAAQTLREQETLLCRDPEQVDRLLAHLEAMQATERARLGVAASLDELTIAAHEKAKRVELAARDQLRSSVVAGVKL